MKSRTVGQALSIDEKKVSVLVICLIICIGFGGYNYIVSGDITNNLTNIILALIAAVAGVNVADRFKAGPPQQPPGDEYNNYNL